ncbi:2Fe-2S iron-sulfur cluster-binding protein [Telmatospirillum sp.]|uniref:2Fe-2S iron-sulfur cluster-binding protein n=1 Tax=Telmatospirillum sp. TaxID=2079197 RepID=UPI002843C2B2|nr:2Fe-2S iron-sulfur cluster-binding protein [Telmatospirillum sp.]MDR3437689.1 2Fe-2S iron-sulfur cluster-binding protein [Telmatospirillum sp.]
MPLVSFIPSGKSVTMSEGASVLQAVLAAGEAIVSKCDGKAQCGGCHVFVHDGRKSLSKIGREENERLDSIVGVGSKSRLACQAKLGSEDTTVEILGFGSGL